MSWFFGLWVAPLQTLPFERMAASEIATGVAILSVVRQIGLAAGTALMASVLNPTSAPGANGTYATAHSLALAAQPGSPPLARWLRSRC
ncbi:hypothetical protein CCUG62472_00580 [Mycobacteroides salmoniphilum]|nr:hypothetical protein CCUG62472_00580 [Mycobacteroides salmoniphilum]